MKRLDELIKYRQTGCMRELADKMSLSERHTYRCINSLKQLGAPVEFSHFHNSYHYVDSGELKLKWEKPKNETNEK